MFVTPEGLLQTVMANEDQNPFRMDGLMSSQKDTNVTILNFWGRAEVEAKNPCCLMWDFVYEGGNGVGMRQSSVLLFMVHVCRDSLFLASGFDS